MTVDRSLVHPAGVDRQTHRRKGALAAPFRVPAVLARHAHRVALTGILGLAALLNLLHLHRNGWGNEYYSAAARSMSRSWSNFWFAAFDSGGLVSVDKTPVALWIQAASVRAFGFSEAAVMVPQALAGVATVGVLYLLVARPWGRVAGLAAALCLAVTPVSVAVARDNNPDAVFILLLVLAAWAAVRATAGGRGRWLVAAGALVGLAFMTKMLLAVVVVPGIAVAYLALAPLPRATRVRHVALAAGAAIVTGGAWVLSVALTPSGSRPWVGSTSDDSILSLMFGYNGLGRVAGQTGGTSFGGGGMGGGAMSGEPGLFRLFNTALGDQIAWLLPLALAGLLSLALAARRDPDRLRRAALVVVGGTFLVSAGVLSMAGGIVHTYYTALLGPWTAAVVGAGVVSLAADVRRGEGAAALPIGAMVVTGLLEMSLRRRTGWLPWLDVGIVVLVGAGVTLAVMAAARHRDDARAPRLATAAVTAGLAGLLLAPTAWSASTAMGASGGVFPGAGPRFVSGLVTTQSGGGPGGLGGRAGGFGGGAPPGMSQGGGTGGTGGGTMGGAGDSSDEARTAVVWAAANGGSAARWDLVVTSEEQAAPLMLDGLRVASMGGFTGRETVISADRFADLVASGDVRYVLISQTRSIGGGSNPSLVRVQNACTAVDAATWSGSSGASGTLYDCRGAAAALRASS